MGLASDSTQQRKAAGSNRVWSSRLGEATHLLLQLTDSTTRRKAMLLFLLALGGAALASAAPLLLKALVDGLSPPAALHDRALLQSLSLAAGYALALVAARIVVEYRLWLAGQIEQSIALQLSTLVFRHLLALPMIEHVQRPAGAMVQTLGQAQTGCQMLMVSVLANVLPVIIELLAVLAVIAHLDQPALILVFLATALAYGLVCGLGAVRIGQRAAEVASAGVDATGRLAGLLGAVESLKVNQAEHRAGSMHGEDCERLRRCWARLHATRLRTGLLLSLVLGLTVGVSLLTATRGVIEGAVSLGGLVLVTVYLLQLLRPLEMLGTSARDIAQALAFVDPVLVLLRLQAEDPHAAKPLEDKPAAPPSRIAQTQVNVPTEPGRPTPAGRTTTHGQAGPLLPPILSLHRVSLELAGAAQQPVLSEIDLAVAAGSCVGIVGTSGSGKSTLLRLLIGLYRPTSGAFLIHGTSFNDWPLERHRARFAFVPQDPGLIDATVAENIALGVPGASRAQIEAAACAAQIHELITTLPNGYACRVGERGARLSGGERQRLAVARALLRQPEVLLLDEATSMLDAQTEAQLLHDLHQFRKGQTTLIVAHRLRTVQQAEQILVMDRGKILESGTHADLRTAGRSYARLWATQTGSPLQDHAH